MAREAELRPLGKHVVAESTRAAAGFVIHVQPAVARLERSPFGKLPVKVRERLPGEARPNADPADVPAHVEAKASSERQSQVCANNGIPPVLGALHAAGGQQDAWSAN